MSSLRESMGCPLSGQLRIGQEYELMAPGEGVGTELGLFDDPEGLAGWATRGALLPVGRSISPGQSVALERVAVPVSWSRPVAYFCVYNCDVTTRVAYLGVFVRHDFRGLGASLLPIWQFLELAFGSLPLDRLLAEVPDYNMDLLVSGNRRLMEVVASLKGHSWQDGQPEDVHILHLSAEKFFSRARLLNAATVRRKKR